MESNEKLKDAYIDYVLTHGEEPRSVYLFAKENDVAEEEFYNRFGGFAGIEKELWKDYLLAVIEEVTGQEVWPQYSSREKALSLFYSFVEFMKGKRSFALQSLKKAGRLPGQKKVLEGLKQEFVNFAGSVISEGIASKELEDRKYLTARYKDALWVQFNVVLDFWTKDDSAGFEKTDEAIEKGVNVTFNFFQRSAFDELIDYGKFMARNAGVV